ncbi:C-terminal binding protein [Ectobacillus ponti]|uniref:C-terminal binding protein n=1 Tax=Ectobacillus ponti TaxID=2961894 RepID=A0AA42BPX4_9BACI|nr:C-terminal binding protein [Ectobacillus ponti]MCP8969670.1 C-terminal binding protein [Ectobacillus ponti]
MTRKVIVITDCDHPSVAIEREVLEGMGFTVVLEQCRTEEDVIAKCQEAYGLINQYAPLTKRVLSSLPNCQVVVRYGVGVDNVDLNAASEAGIQVCNVPDYGVEEVSDHALALIFALKRKINLLSNDVKQNNWDFQICRPIRRLRDLTLGVVGLGRIGQATARKAKGLGWNVISYDRNEKRTMAGVQSVTFNELLETADIISVHVPLSTDTHHLFSQEAFRRMKRGAIIVNTARGPIINERALEEAIHTNQIAGAALDVMEQEPPQPNHPLFRFDNVIITPHAAWYSEEASFDLKRKAAEEAGRVVLGEAPYNPVNELQGIGGTPR